MKNSNIDHGFAEQRIRGQKKLAIITGANSGLGFETARVLLLHGMRVVCACRNLDKGAVAVDKLRQLTKERADATPQDIILMKLDVSSLSSVHEFAQEFKKSGLPIHVLLCNAGIMMGPARRSADGIDLQVATNHLGHFLLCSKLQEHLLASAPARIIHVSSVAARMGSIDFDNLNPSAEGYNSMRVYQMSKLMQVVFSRELNRRLEGTGVTSNSLEPGVVATNLSTGITDNPAMKARIEKGVSVEEGAKTHIYLAASSSLNGIGGRHYEDCTDISQGIQKFKYILAAHSLRKSVGSKLWEASEQLINEHGASTFLTSTTSTEVFDSSDIGSQDD